MRTIHADTSGNQCVACGSRGFSFAFFTSFIAFQCEGLRGLVHMMVYHMPFPAAGFVEPRGDGFRFVPVSYQMMG